MLTRFFKCEEDFHEWCQHHFSLGIDHVHVFDDGTAFNLEKSCEIYGDSVSYERVFHPQQQQLYNRYIPECTADFIMPIDDDEYLWVSPELGSIKTAIEYYVNKYHQFDVFGIRWLYKFPKIFHSERNCGVLEYCTEECDELATKFSNHGNAIIKCLVRKSAFVRYMDADESTIRNHIPLTIGSYGAMMCNGHIKNRHYVYEKLDDEKIRLIHCPYKGYSEYADKRQHHLSVSHQDQRKREYSAFNSILDTLL